MNKYDILNLAFILFCISFIIISYYIGYYFGFKKAIKIDNQILEDKFSKIHNKSNN